MSSRPDIGLPAAVCRLAGPDASAAAAATAAVAAGAAPDSHLVGRLLEDGDRAAVAWLRRQVPAAALAGWLERHGPRRLSRRSLSFWAVMLNRPDLRPERLPALRRRRELWPF